MAPVSAKRIPAARTAHAKGTYAKDGPHRPQMNTGKLRMDVNILEFHPSWMEEMENYKKRLEKQKRFAPKRRRLAKVATNSNVVSTLPSHQGAVYSIKDRKTPKLTQHKPSGGRSVRRQTGGEIYQTGQFPLKKAHSEGVHAAKGCADTNSSCTRAQEQCSTSNRGGAPPSLARKITVNRFHASSFLNTRQVEEKTRILTQNGVTLSAATAYLASLQNFSLLPKDDKSNSKQNTPPKSCSTNSSNHTKAKVEEKAIIPIVEGPCAPPDELADCSDTDPEEEKYVGHPFYLDGEEYETHQSHDACQKYLTPECVLSPSLFPNVPPYMNFASHSKKGPAMPTALHKMLTWKISHLMPRIVRRVVRNSGFDFVDNPDCMGIWEHIMRNTDFDNIHPHQKYNHLPGSYRIGRKDNMWRSIRNKIKKFGPVEFGLMQTTYIMPNDIDELREVWRKHTARLTKWIVKPPASARGAGIRVVTKWGQFCKNRSLIVQKYIERPLLINDSKFDLRLYVAVTSIDPLKIFMYKEGLARFASKKYSREVDSLDDRCMHLTNYSINKFSESYSKNMDFNTCQGHKWTLQSLWCCLEQRGVNTKRLWATLRNLVIKSIISGESGMSRMYRQNVSHRYNCYELFGFDVLLDKNLVPWLLEVNMSPSLHCDLPLDRHVKGPLIQALLNTVLYQLPPGLDKQQQADIIRKLSVPCSSLCMDKRLLTTCLTAKEANKQKMYSNMELREQYLEDILTDLLPDDVRCLIIAEDELNRSDPLERVFPTAHTHQYHKFMENPRYYNRLLDAWENRYGTRRADGIALLRQLCEEGYHLQ